MPLIKSISGIRGTIGGETGDSLSPLDVVKFAAAYASLICSKNIFPKKIVLGRDARISGGMIRDLVIGTLVGMGVDIVDIGLATTPTTELAVGLKKASGGIVLTASHNSEQWNALKLLNEKGELLNTIEWNEFLQVTENKSFTFVSAYKLGKVTTDDSCARKHIDHILALKLVDINAIRRANFKVVIDTVNSVGGIIVPQLLKALGVKQIVCINTDPTGIFAHNPEPLPQHLSEIAEVVKQEKASIGFAVDPDVDRLAIIMETGGMFGEEYTLVSIASYILSQTPGNTVSNMSSTRALRDITEKYGYVYTASAVGEANVIEKMKETNAIIGGEGNGGIIYPESHYGRDALVGIALFLTYFAKSGKKVSELRASYPNYYMAKRQIDLIPDIDRLLNSIKKKYITYFQSDMDGIKIDFPNNCWVHLRKSNTEPLLRIYAEATSQVEANLLIQSIINPFIKE